MKKANVHFLDGTKVPFKDEVKYLGVDINDTGKMKKEISKRLTAVWLTIKRLDHFWLHSNCPVKFKLIATDAIVRAKLLYGLDSAQLGDTELKRLEVMQVQILRKS